VKSEAYFGSMGYQEWSVARSERWISRGGRVKSEVYFGSMGYQEWSVVPGRSGGFGVVDSECGFHGWAGEIRGVFQ